MDKNLFNVNEGQKLVLEIGPNTKPQAQYIPSLEGAKIISMDVDASMKPDIIADAADMPKELLGKFDAIVASHVLEHFSYWKTAEVLDGWVACLRDGGELHILVPSLEWAARQVLAEKPSPAVYAQLYAGQVNQWDVHLTGFTMRKLRFLFEKAGLHAFIARTGEYHIRVGNMGEFPAEQHYIAGTKGAPQALRKE